jgi:protein-disulfide isomerase
MCRVGWDKLGEAALDQPVHGLLDTRLFGQCSRWAEVAASSLIALLILGVGIASAAVPQTTPSPAKAARPAKTDAGMSAAAKTYGVSSAPIRMEIFTDYQCPTCGAFYEHTLRQMITEYVAAGKVYLVHHDFPLPMHKYSGQAARWANAAALVGQFQNVEVALYDNQAAWSADGDMGKYISAAMSSADFKKVQKLMEGCEQPGPTADQNGGFGLPAAGPVCPLDSEIEQDITLGKKVPVTGTPTYLITAKGQHIPAASGNVSWPILKQFFDSLLGQ